MTSKKNQLAKIWDRYMSKDATFGPVVLLKKVYTLKKKTHNFKTRLSLSNLKTTNFKKCKNAVQILKLPKITNNNQNNLKTQMVQNIPKKNFIFKILKD